MEEIPLKISFNNVNKNILDLFYKLCDNDASIRLNACAYILSAVAKKQEVVEKENELCPDLQYSIERLIKGLASPRKGARLGYCLLLTQILKKISCVQVEEVSKLIKNHLIITEKQDKRDLVFGQLFAYTSIIRSGRLSDHSYLPIVLLSLFDLCQGRSYILNPSYKVFLDTLSEIKPETFKEIVWKPLKKKLPNDWDNCSADTMWLLLLCLRLFPNSVSKKYLTTHWAADDIFAAENLNHIKRIIKQTSSCLPMLHPFCSEAFLLLKQREDFKEIWISVVDDNLFDADQKEKVYIGFEMVKLALKTAPTKKIVKTVLSSKFRAIFCKIFLSSKHPMNPAANHLAEFFGTFVKENTVPDIQIIVLKALLQPPGTVLLDQVLKKKEVSQIIPNLLPDAVKKFSEILKSIVLTKKPSSGDEKEVNNMKRFQAVQQLGNLIAHPSILSDMEWRLDTIRFLFLHSFFSVKKATSELPHCEKQYDTMPDSMRDACVNAFFKAINSLQMRTGNEQSSLSIFLQQLIVLTEYAELLMNSTKNVEPLFSIEKIQNSWSHLKTIVHKLNKQSKKDGLENESNAFQALFLQLGFQLFQDTDNIPKVLEELYICCKKALKSRKNETSSEDGEDEPPWIGVVIDILLSLLSNSSRHLRSLVTYVFPLFCPFIDQNALQQILDVINPQNDAEDMLIDDTEENKDAEDVDFGSGSSSDESEDEQDMQPVDDEFKKKIQQALGSAADNSDAESVVLSDSEMFKLDDALSHAFKSRLKSSNSQLPSEEKTLMFFRIRTCDLIMAYMKSEPPMSLALMCLVPVLTAFEFSHTSKHHNPLLLKTLNVLQTMTRIKKFQNHQNVSKSDLKGFLDVLIPKCQKEINISTAQKLYNLCVFIVLCFRKLETSDPDKKDKKKRSKIPSYIKTYLSNLETFAHSGQCHLIPQFFTYLMEACPELSWHFIEPCKNYVFCDKLRLYKKTQCLGLISEAIKYSKGQKTITDDQWLEFGNDILPFAVEEVKKCCESSEDIKPVYFQELLNIIFTIHSVIQEKTGKSLLKDYQDLLPVLSNNKSTKLRKNCKCRSLKNKIIICLGGNVNENKKSEKKQMKRKSKELTESENLVNGDVTKQNSKKKIKKEKKSPETSSVVEISEGLSDETN